MKNIVKAVSLLLVLTALACGLATNKEGKEGKEGKLLHMRKHRSVTHNFEFTKNQRVTIDAGFYFDFGAARRTVKTAFTWFGKVPVILNVFDCYCTGDLFDVYDNGAYLGTTSNGITDSTCQYYSDQPITCFQNQNDIDVYWNYFVQSLYPGIHNVSIVPNATPYGKGSAYLRVDANWNTEACCSFNNNCKYDVVN